VPSDDEGGATACLVAVAGCGTCVPVGLGAMADTGVLVGLGVLVDMDVLVGLGVLVDMDVLVGLGVLVGIVVLVGQGVSVATSSSSLSPQPSTRTQVIRMMRSETLLTFIVPSLSGKVRQETPATP
jgi:hypothetical protein